MKYISIIAALLLLAACVPEYVPPPQTVKEPPKTEIPPLPAAERTIPLPYTKVWQTRGDEQMLWGFDQEGKLILLNSSTRSVVLSYKGKNLVTIDDGVKPVTFFYDHDRLLSAQKGITRWIFTYTSKGTLLTMENDEKVRASHDSKGRLSSIARDGGASTEFVYDDKNRTKSMFKDKIETTMFYDRDGRLARMDRWDDHLVIAYWREDLLSSLSGTMYGLKETVNYGPTEIKLVSNVEENVFASTYADEIAARMKAFNTFLFCTRFRKLPVLFDGQSWVLYHEYFKGNITDYLLTSFMCDHLP